MRHSLLGIAFALLISACTKSEAATSPEGRALFATACARCHGADGTGGLPLTDGGAAPRNFTDHAFQSTHTDFDIQQTIVNGKASGMPAFGSTFNDEQLRALVQHVRSLDNGGRKQP